MSFPKVFCRAGACRRAVFACSAARRRAAALQLALVCAVFARAEVKVGDAFPALASAGLTPLSGAEPKSDDCVLLVDFWASWCAPCKASFPMMARLHQDYAARGLVIVAIGVDEKPAAAAAFVKKLAPPFATLHDREQKLVQQVSVPTMPTSYLIDREGRVRFMHVGFYDRTTEREMRTQLEALLAEKK